MLGYLSFKSDLSHKQLSRLMQILTFVRTVTFSTFTALQALYIEAALMQFTI